MATTYSSTFYTSAGAILIPPASTMIGGIKGDAVNETIPTTVTNGVNERYLMPLPFTGNNILLGFWLQAADFDTGGPTLDADLVMRYTLNGVAQTDIVIYDSSVLGLFSATLAMKWVPLNRRKFETADNGVGHLIFKVGVAATTPASGALIVLPWWL